MNPVIPKIVLVGSSGVGKTALAKKFLSPGAALALDNIKPTLGMEVHPVTFRDGVCANVWDVAGSKKFGELRNKYYAGAAGFIIVLGPDKTQENFERWFAEVSGRGSRIVVALNDGAELRNVPNGVGSCRLNIVRGENLEAPFRMLC